MLDWFQEWLPILVLIATAIHGGLIWALRRASKTEVTAVGGRVNTVEEQARAIENRVANLEELGKLLPTREDLHLLRLELMETKKDLERGAAVMEGSQRSFADRVEDSRRYIDRQIASTDKLVERTEATVRMVTEHLLDKGK